jgi:hypothetical protein
MEEDAYHKLEKLSLPCPKIYLLDELVEEASENKYYYLRYRTKVDLPKFVSSRYLSEHLDLFRKLCIEGKLIQIEEGIVSVIGGCVVTMPSPRYLELVSGHLSGLLKNGWCFLRAYLYDTDWSKTLLQQKLMIEQRIEGTRVSPSAHIEQQVIDSLLSSVRQLLQKIELNYLFEFIVDDNNHIYFVDLKQYSWSIDYASLLEKRKEGYPIYSRNRVPVNERTYDGEFSLEKLDQIDASTIIRLKNNALLSHFITYSLRNGIAGITT